MTGIELYKRIGRPSANLDELTINERLEMDWNYCCAFLVKHNYYPNPDNLLWELELACVKILQKEK